MNEQNKTKILIVEDDANMRGALTRRFTNEGFFVIVASDGGEGVSRALSEKPDLILLDIMMPKMDGMTAMKTIRQDNDWGRRVPIILLTSLEADDKIMKGVVEDEPSYYVIKDNFTMDGLVEKVKERLARK